MNGHNFPPRGPGYSAMWCDTCGQGFSFAAISKGNIPACTGPSAAVSPTPNYYTKNDHTFDLNNTIQATWTGISTRCIGCGGVYSLKDIQDPGIQLSPKSCNTPVSAPAPAPVAPQTCTWKAFTDPHGNFMYKCDTCWEEIPAGRFALTPGYQTRTCMATVTSVTIPAGSTGTLSTSSMNALFKVAYQSIIDPPLDDEGYHGSEDSPPPAKDYDRCLHCDLEISPTLDAYYGRHPSGHSYCVKCRERPEMREYFENYRG